MLKLTDHSKPHNCPGFEGYSTYLCTESTLRSLHAFTASDHTAGWLKCLYHYHTIKWFKWWLNDKSTGGFWTTCICWDLGMDSFCHLSHVQFVFIEYIYLNKGWFISSCNHKWTGKVCSDPCFFYYKSIEWLFGILNILYFVIFWIILNEICSATVSGLHS